MKNLRRQTGTTFGEVAGPRIPFLLRVKRHPGLKTDEHSSPACQVCPPTRHLRGLARDIRFPRWPKVLNALGLATTGKISTGPASASSVPSSQWGVKPKRARAWIGKGTIRLSMWLRCPARRGPATGFLARGWRSFRPGSQRSCCRRRYHGLSVHGRLRVFSPTWTVNQAKWSPC